MGIYEEQGTVTEKTEVCTNDPAEALDILARLAAVLCDGEEASIDEVRQLFAGSIDQTLLDPACGPHAVASWAMDNATLGFSTLCVQPCWVGMVDEILAEASTETLACTVIGFPHGQIGPEEVAFATYNALQSGAYELDLVMNVGAFLEGESDIVCSCIDAMVDAAETFYANSLLEGLDQCGCGCGCGDEGCDEGCDEDCCDDDDDDPDADGCGCGCHDHGHGNHHHHDCSCVDGEGDDAVDEDACECEGGDDAVDGDVDGDYEPIDLADRISPFGLKVIIETGRLTDEQICAATDLVSSRGIDYVKTCTGFGPRGATVQDVRLMRSCVEPGVEIKAAGGIRNLMQALDLLEAGATRLGCSCGERLLDQFDELTELAAKVS